MSPLQMAWLLLLAAAADAAITSHHAGGYVDLASGLAVAGAPLAPAGTLDLGVGGWWGIYDDELSFGRYWGVGVRLQEDVQGDEVAPRALVQIRRGMDLIVVGVHGFAGVGPLFLLSSGQVGASGRVGGAIELRRSPLLGAVLSLEGGADVIGGAVHPAGSLLLGVHAFFAGPVQR